MVANHRALLFACMNIIKNNIVEACLTIALLLCLWAIGSIQLHFIPLIPCPLSQVQCDGWNSMFVNLSYSFIAGYIFYLLTVVLKNYHERKKMHKVLDNKVKQIASPIEAIIDIYYGEMGANVDRSREGITKILNSQNFNDKVKMAAELGHQLGKSATYINFLAEKCKDSKERVFEMIRLYQDYLTTDEIILLESYAAMRVIDVASIASAINCIDANRTDVKQTIITQFCDLYDKLNEVRAVFAKR